MQLLPHVPDDHDHDGRADDHDHAGLDYDFQHDFLDKLDHDPAAVPERAVYDEPEYGADDDEYEHDLPPTVQHHYFNDAAASVNLDHDRAGTHYYGDGCPDDHGHDVPLYKLDLDQHDDVYVRRPVNEQHAP
jgi:hypothetical protein